MNYNTIDFVLIFLPLAVLGFYLVPMRLRIYFISFVSLVFYGYSGLLPLFFLVASVVWGYLCAYLPRSNRAGTLISIFFPLLVLFVFKYLGFTFSLVGFAPAGIWQDIVSISMPAGISFYTFQIVSYSLDQRDGRLETETDFSKLLAYVSFFPQLIAGPIIRYDDIKGQLAALTRNRILKPDWNKAFKFLSIGLFAKIFLADIPRGFQEKVLTTGSQNSLDHIFSIVTYSFVIYYDFWSYSLMAIGLAAMFCIKLPRNFLEPYLAANPKAFWRRWHVSLSFWLRDYVYLKLGGNKAYARNIAIVFISCGIWHGAGTNFMVWGAYHAVLVVGYHYSRDFWNRLPDPIAIFLTFGLVTLGWPLFYLDLGAYVSVLALVFSFDFKPASIYGYHHIAYLAVVAFITFAFKEEKWLFNARKIAFVDSAVVHALLALAAVSFFSFGKTFIYFVF